MSPVARRVVVIIGLVAAYASVARAQERLRVHADVLFYGDNTEFRNPFREGETIFGTAARIFAVAPMSDSVFLSGGAHGRQRFGDDEGFDQIRPALSLTVRGARSTFVIGTLPSASLARPPGDPDTLHGLLPPLQRETLLFERAYETGLLWTTRTAALEHAAWLNWQRLNTAEHRERFDAGAVARVRLSRAFSAPLQAHIVHEGGQQFASGPVSDSYAGAAGLAFSRQTRDVGGWRIEGHALASRHVPDRETPSRSRTGRALLTRATVAAGPWRAHLLFWRGHDFVKDEGDPNYLSLRRDGRYYGGIRDYAEAGLGRDWRPAQDVRLHASARVHRTERHYEYSFRILAVAAVDWLVPPKARQHVHDH